MKKLLIGIAVFVAVLVAAVVFLLGNIDKIVKGELEGVGSELLGVPLKVTAVNIKLDSGSGQITGLTIANPPKYSDPNAFRMDMIGLRLDLRSLPKQPLVIDELNIENPVVYLEVKEDGSLNLQDLLNNIDKNSAKANKKAAEQPTSEATHPGEPIRISFGKLSVTGVTVHVSAPGQEPQKVVIPDIVEENVGGETGATPAEIGKLIVGRIIQRSLENTVKKSLTKKVEEAAKGFLEGLKDKYKF